MSDESKAIYVAMASILKDVDAIEKTRSSSGNFAFKFRGIDDVLNTLNPLFGKHRVFLLQQVLDHSVTEKVTKSNASMSCHLVKVEFTFVCEDGSSVSSIVCGEAADSGDKGFGKAMSYALKVCLLQTFLIPTEEEKDPDAHNHELQNKHTASPVKYTGNTATDMKHTIITPAAPAPVKPAPKAQEPHWSEREKQEKAAQASMYMNQTCSVGVKPVAPEAPAPLDVDWYKHDIPAHKELLIATAAKLGISVPRLTKSKKRLVPYLESQSYAREDDLTLFLTKFFKEEDVQA